MVLVSYAQNPDDMKQKFAAQFSDYMAIGADIHEGVQEFSPVFTGDIFKTVSGSVDRGGWIEYYGQLHVNFS